ncbi:hypothetical protein B2I21_18900 [Chryseobacterium mucoviscidosis]|nr:hypothetical protein B2I21_18900 [Chryseobacterium mucoviscidosis]
MPENREDPVIQELLYGALFFVYIGQHDWRIYFWDVIKDSSSLYITKLSEPGGSNFIFTAGSRFEFI